jgi:hypothetical protein
MTEERRTPDGPDDPEVISDEEWSDENATGQNGAGENGEVGPTDDDPQGMRGQLDDSMNGLEPGDDEGEAARGIPQNADTETDTSKESS